MTTATQPCDHDQKNTCKMIQSLTKQNETDRKEYEAKYKELEEYNDNLHQQLRQLKSDNKLLDTECKYLRGEIQ